MSAARKTISVSSASQLKESGTLLRNMHRRGLLAPNRFKTWIAALESGKYVKSSLFLGTGDPTPEDPINFEGVLRRSPCGILCEISGMARLVNTGRRDGALAQQPVEIEGLPTSAMLKHAPEYTYEQSVFFPCAGARAFLIASNRLDDYSDSERLQRELIFCLERIEGSVHGGELLDVAIMLKRATAPFML